MAINNTSGVGGAPDSIETRKRNGIVDPGDAEVLTLKRAPSAFLHSTVPDIAIRPDEYEAGPTGGASAICPWPKLVPFPKSPVIGEWGKHMTISQRNLLAPDEELDPVEQVHVYHPKSKHFNDNVFVAFDLCC